MTKGLAEYVADNYHYKFTGRKLPVDPVTALQNGMAQDPELKEAARQRLANIPESSIADERCVITKTERDLLRRALGV